MFADLTFLLGLLDDVRPPCVSQEDFDGPHGLALRTWQRLGFVSQEPGVNPAASCPHCGDGVPFPVRTRYVCNRCGSDVDRGHLLLWPLDLDTFLHWLTGRLSLRGGVRRIDDFLWQMGTWDGTEGVFECFFRRQGLLSEVGENRLAAFRVTIVFYGTTLPTRAEGSHGPTVSLLEVLRLEDQSLTVRNLERLLRPRGNVRFDAHSGALWVGDRWIGEVPVGSKEFSFLRCLAQHLDYFVAYVDIKHAVLAEAGSTDTTEEATFCQGLKSRIKKKWVPKIDLLVVTTNKKDGYRMRGYAEW